MAFDAADLETLRGLFAPITTQMTAFEARLAGLDTKKKADEDAAKKLADDAKKKSDEDKAAADALAAGKDTKLPPEVNALMQELKKGIADGKAAFDKLQK